MKKERFPAYEEGQGKEVLARLPSSEDYQRYFEDQGLGAYARGYEGVIRIAETIEREGGQALLVGGFVRDTAMGKLSKDFDVEVYGLEPQRLEEIAHATGKTSDVGRAFGILKISFGGGVDIDLSLPRTDSKIGTGHRGFEIKVDPGMNIKDAARRRDFTMNAMAADPLTREVFDPFGGREDIRRRILRVTDPERFKDDPLRVLRALQFIGRFGLTVDKESRRIMEEMTPALKELPKERVFEEWKKLLLKSEMPSVGLSAGMALGVWHELYPDLIPPLRETPQEAEWHPEGDVWIHTMLAVDRAASIARREELDDEKALTVLLATLCHDFGKPATTQFERGRVRSLAHEQAGEEPTRKFLHMLGVDNLTTQKVVKLVIDHLKPSMAYIDETVRNISVTDGAIRRLAGRIAPATLYELTLVAEADHTGRGPFADPQAPEQFLLPLEGYPAGKWFMERARLLKVEKSAPPDVILGRDLLGLGLKSGREIGEIIRSANHLRDEKEYTREMVLAALDGVKDHKEAIEKLAALTE